MLGWLPQVRKSSGKKILQDVGKVREFHFESGKIEVFEGVRAKGNFKSTYLFFFSSFIVS